MKRIVLLTFIGSLALALTAFGAPQAKKATRSAKPTSTQAAHTVSAARSSHVAPARVSRSIGPGVATHSSARASTMRGNRMVPPRMRSAPAMHRAASAKTLARSRAALNHERTVARANTARTARTQAARSRTARNLVRENAVQRNGTEPARIRNERVSQATRAAARRNLTVNRQRNLTFAHNVLRNRTGDVRVTNNWRNARFNGARYAAFYNYQRTWHDRAWWRSNFTTIVFVGGGWWAWWDGYWYPCWGYVASYWYPYDGPIYTGYATLTPGRVIVEVQQQLGVDGYYAGPIDGRMGPQTRAGIAAFQADNGLTVTSTIDQPTLQTLGLA